MIFLISVSSTALSCAAVISPLSRLARASFSGVERRMLPTWSARNGGLVLGIDFEILVFGQLPITVSLVRWERRAMAPPIPPPGEGNGRFLKKTPPQERQGGKKTL